MSVKSEYVKETLARMAKEFDVQAGWEEEESERLYALAKACETRSHEFRQRALELRAETGPTAPATAEDAA